MNKIISINNFLLIFLGFFSFFINYYYGNIGVFPIDTFAFFDTGYNILLDRHPFKDVWITTGPLVDYLQAIFFKFFGLNWKSYIIHASFLNLATTIIFYLVLVQFKLDKYLSFFYSISLSILCYTVSGAPFAYTHSYVLSLISLLIFFLIINTESKLSFIFLPIFMFLSFFSMQTPSTYINGIIILFLLVYFFNNFKIKNLSYFLLGCFFVIFSFSIYLYVFKIPIINIIQQYFLFPLSIGEYRVSGNDMAHISLLERFTFRNIVGHFKFINIFILFFIVFSVIEIFKKRIEKKDFIINSCLILTGITLIFNQLITSNQTYIFSLIPFIGAFFHLYIQNKFPELKKFRILLLIIVAFSVFKYHDVYNLKRKFIDLQNVDLKKSVNASLLDKKFNNLKWITPNYPTNPEREIFLIKETLEHLKQSNKNKMVLTEYQFFSVLIEDNLNIPNRWYTHDNNSYPLANHKYFKFYKKHFSNNIINNNIEIIYTIGDPKLKNYLIYMDNICFDESNFNEITFIYKIKKCV